MPDKLKLFPADQDWLIDRIQQLGYFNADGICFGFNRMLEQAALSSDPEDLTVFINRLYLINNIPLEHFKTTLETAKATYATIVQNAKTTVKAQKNSFANAELFNTAVEAEIQSILNSERYEQERDLLKEVINIYALFEGIEIYQKPQIHPELFEKKIKSQDVNASEALVLPKKLLAQQGLKRAMVSENKLEKVFVNSGIYNKHELGVFFKALKETFLQNSVTHPIAINLSLRHSENYHTMNVIYNPQRKTWLPIDINHLKFEETQDEDSLAQTLFEFFDLSELEEDCITFSSKLTQVGSQSEKLNEYVRQLKKNHDWKLLHTVTPEKTKRISAVANDTWLHNTLAYGNDLDIETKILRTESDLQVKDIAGDTPLHVALTAKKTAISKLLIQEGAPVNEKNDNNETPLMIAAKDGNLEIIDALLNAGVNPKIDPGQIFLQALATQRNADGETLFAVALKRNLPHVAKLFISLGADVNEKNKNGDYPLFLALQRNDASLITALLEAGANPNEQIGNGVMTMLDFAILQKNPTAVRELLRCGADANKTADINKYTPLVQAIELGDPITMKNLLQAGANPLALSAPNNRTAVQAAIEFGHPDLLNLILEFHPLVLDKHVTIELDILEKYAKKLGRWHELELVLKEMNNGKLPQQITGLTSLHWASIYGLACFSKLVDLSPDELEAKEWDKLLALVKALNHEDLVNYIEYRRDYANGMESEDFSEDNEGVGLIITDSDDGRANEGDALLCKDSTPDDPLSTENKESPHVHLGIFSSSLHNLHKKEIVPGAREDSDPSDSSIDESKIP